MTAVCPLRRPRSFRFLHALRLLFASGKEERPQVREVNAQAARMLDTYGNSILRLAYSYLHNYSDAEEVLQDTLLQVLRTAPTLENPRHEKAWLLRVTVNCCKKLHRSFWRRNTVALSESIPALSQEEGELLDLLEGLPEKYRAVLHLYYYEGYATGEIADILGRTHGKERKSYDGRELSRPV